MTRPPQLVTATMAKLYADQGYLTKAAAIYRQLIDQNPHRRDLSDALSLVETQIEQREKPNLKELGLLIREWIDLQKACENRKPHGGKGNS
jgi:hypothetical protein